MFKFLYFLSNKLYNITVIKTVIDFTYNIFKNIIDISKGIYNKIIYGKKIKEHKKSKEESLVKQSIIKNKKQHNNDKEFDIDKNTLTFDVIEDDLSITDLDKVFDKTTDIKLYEEEFYKTWFKNFNKLILIKINYYLRKDFNIMSKKNLYAIIDKIAVNIIKELKFENNLVSKYYLANYIENIIKAEYKEIYDIIE